MKSSEEGNTVRRERIPTNAERKGSVNRIESFLSSYKPKDRSFTSNAEIKKITDVLGLDEMSASELTEARNNVVRYYSRKMDDGNFDFMPSLQSVTSVIDYVKVRKYGFV